MANRATEDTGKRQRAAKARALRVGEAAEAAGVGVQTLHFYEREGLIAVPPRSPAGYREYDAHSVERVRAIKRAQRLGFTLAEVRDLIEVAEGRSPAVRIAEVARQRVEAIDATVAELGRMRSALVEAFEHCACGGEPRHCDVLEGLARDEREGGNER